MTFKKLILESSILDTIYDESLNNLNANFYWTIYSEIVRFLPDFITIPRAIQKLKL